MNLNNYYYCFQQALGEKFCEDLINYGVSKQEELALTGGQSEKVSNGKKLSDDDIKDLKKNINYQ